eukprot:6311640-Prorocentrum_lima.AAC.1
MFINLHVYTSPVRELILPVLHDLAKRILESHATWRDFGGVLVQEKSKMLFLQSNKGSSSL